ncbi:MAG: hypothetical protein KAW56_15755 [Candidatus Marinimicrobia bacterium]|nr:hypothetical protein [Candidatus Neomarinimicrobiota bacterium]
MSIGFKKNIIFCTLLLTIFYLSCSEIAYSQINSIKKVGGSGGNGSKISLKDKIQVLNYSDKVRISYPSLANHSERQGSYIIMNKTENHTHDGIYIWKENNRYILSWFGMNPLEISGKIIAEGEISICREVITGVEEKFNKTNSFNLSDILIDEIKHIKIYTSSKVTEFDILINGVYDPNRIFIGDKEKKPSQIPFQLEIYFNPKERGIIIKKDKRKELEVIDWNQDSSSPSSKARGGGRTNISN